MSQETEGRDSAAGGVLSEGLAIFLILTGCALLLFACCWGGSLIVNVLLPS